MHRCGQDVRTHVGYSRRQRAVSCSEVPEERCSCQGFCRCRCYNLVCLGVQLEVDLGEQWPASTAHVEDCYNGAKTDSEGLLIEMKNHVLFSVRLRIRVLYQRSTLNNCKVTRLYRLCAASIDPHPNYHELSVCLQVFSSFQP